MKRFIQGKEFRACTAAVLLLATPLVAAGFERTEQRAACADFNRHRNPYFGDLHVHTTYSPDAAVFAVTTTPRDAYGFAKGDPIGLPPYDASGAPLRTTQLSRPLDFAAVTDHAEFFGEMDICMNQPDLPGYAAPLCAISRADKARYSDPATPGTPGVLPTSFLGLLSNVVTPTPARPTSICGADLSDCAALAPVVWQDTLAAAEEAYDRSRACTFTSLVAYEWTAHTGGANLHRNVIFRNASVPALPITYFEASKAQNLWSALESGCKQGIPGCDVLAIPHNSNISLGVMFNPVNADGGPITAEDAAFRSAMEPLVEITQIKGSSECRPGVLTSDEQCDFESMDRTSLAGAINPAAAFAPNAFVRNALKEGLRQEELLGANPFKLGFIGSTDTHNSNPGDTDESSYGTRGGGGGGDATPELMLSPYGPAGIETNAGGLAVVWAEENSRDSIFEALRRREVYATSGTRPIVRFFGGWKYGAGLCNRKRGAGIADHRGVPMGGDLKATPPRAGAPKFFVSALMDAGTPAQLGTPLQRIQIVKGWVDADGNTQEQVFDVAGDANNGAAVDTDTCETSGPGADSLCAVWEDPGFDASQRAFYYARVLENPTCRWSQRYCNSLGVDCSDPPNVPAEYAQCCDARVNKTVQERAWTSPIWYKPQG
ncbi:MAG: DUF3604 domain-containing protein [Deltaproteobacteria bacterium]|nr:DUF3604 domain-containing protein [Deltaproteobacteria bacterium]